LRLSHQSNARIHDTINCRHVLLLKAMECTKISAWMADKNHEQEIASQSIPLK
jgi:hypothetical protein